MDSSDLRQQIIDSLQKYLPNIACSLGKLVGYLQKIINNDMVKDKDTLAIIIDELENLLPALETVIDNWPTQEANLSNRIESLYRESIINIGQGLKEMITWIKNDDEPEERLIKSINQLYKAGQQVTELVNNLTNNN